jgi:hypothetical protein
MLVIRPQILQTYFHKERNSTSQPLQRPPNPHRHPRQQAVRSSETSEQSKIRPSLTVPSKKSLSYHSSKNTQHR